MLQPIKARAYIALIGNQDHVLGSDLLATKVPR